MRILVTGAAGYIGSRLVSHLLRSGHEVFALDRFDFGAESLTSLLGTTGLQVVKGDVTDPGVLSGAMQGCQAAVFLAAVVGEPACNADPVGAERTNRDAAISGIRIAEQCGLKSVVFLSTCSNYGVVNPDVLADEDAPLNPLSLYASTKVDVEEFALQHKGDVAVTVLRFGTICGLSGRMRFDLLVNDMARAAALGATIELYRPHAWRPYLHVSDAALAIEHVLGRSPDQVAGRVFNVVGENYQKSGLADIARKHYPDVRVVVTEAQPDNRDYRVSGDRIRRELGFATKHTVEEAFVEIARAVREGVFVDPLWPGYCATPLRSEVAV